MVPEAEAPAHRILVVDDEPSMRDLARTALEFVGYEVAEASDGLEALGLVPTFRPDLVVLDVMMPNLDGLEVCRRLRADNDHTPVIFLTARDDPRSEIEGLGVGADDYLTKPFHLQVLIARVATVLRRSGAAVAEAEGDRLTYADVELDAAAHRVRRGGALVELAPTEFKLLRYFMLNPEVVLSKVQIAEHLWQYDFDGDPNVVETYISYLRKKLGAPRLIETVRGFGYALRAEDR